MHRWGRICSDTLFLVGRRAELVQQHCSQGSHGMLVAHATADKIKSLLKPEQGLDDCEVACLNGPKSTVISGPAVTLENIQGILGSHSTGITSSTMSVPYAFHSSQMDPIRPPFLKVASSVRFSKPIVPVASTVLGGMVHSESENIFSASYLAEHARQTVRFEDALRSSEDAGLVNENS